MRVWGSRFPDGTPQARFALSAFPGGALGKNFLPIAVTVSRIELIWHDLRDAVAPGRGAHGDKAVANDPIGWKPLSIMRSAGDSAWTVEQDDGRVIVRD